MSTPENISIKSSKNYLSMLNSEDDFLVRYVDCNRTLVSSDGFWGTHTQVSYEIILIEHGKYQCELDGKKVELKPWDLLTIQPGQKHRDYLYKGCSFLGFHFFLLPNTGRKLPPLIFASGTEPEQQIIHLHKHDFFLFLIENLLKRNASPRKETGYFHLHNALFESFFRKVLLLYPDEVFHETVSHQINHETERELVCAVFSRYLTETPSLEELCVECRMSRSALHRLCMKLFGMPPRKAFIHYKILQAQNFILKNPGIRVKEVGEAFGFKNPFHFSRVFRKETGGYPKKFTKSAITSPE